MRRQRQRTLVCDGAVELALASGAGGPLGRALFFPSVNVAEPLAVLSPCVVVCLQRQRWCLAAELRSVQSTTGLSLSCIALSLLAATGEQLVDGRVHALAARCAHSRQRAVLHAHGGALRTTWWVDPGCSLRRFADAHPICRVLLVSWPTARLAALRSGGLQPAPQSLQVRRG